MCLVHIWHRKRTHETPHRSQITPAETVTLQIKMHHISTICDTRATPEQIATVQDSDWRGRHETDSRLGSRTPTVGCTAYISPSSAVYSHTTHAPYIRIGLRTAPRLTISIVISYTVLPRSSPLGSLFSLLLPALPAV